eukprot:3789960-Rhodomonas_salina.1
MSHSSMPSVSTVQNTTAYLMSVPYSSTSYGSSMPMSDRTSHSVRNWPMDYTCIAETVLVLDTAYHQHMPVPGMQ